MQNHILFPGCEITSYWRRRSLEHPVDSPAWQIRHTETHPRPLWVIVLIQMCADLKAIECKLSFRPFVTLGLNGYCWCLLTIWAHGPQDWVRVAAWKGFMSFAHFDNRSNNILLGWTLPTLCLLIWELPAPFHSMCHQEFLNETANMFLMSIPPELPLNDCSAAWQKPKQVQCVVAVWVPWEKEFKDPSKESKINLWRNPQQALDVKACV